MRHPKRACLDSVLDSCRLVCYIVNTARLSGFIFGEEALAIAVYCAVRHSGDIDGALAAAVNHSGDSDSTGAIAGNIVGAQVGLSGIPAKYTENLELRDLITEVADDLWHDCRTGGDGSVPDPVWKQKYMDICYGRD